MTRLSEASQWARSRPVAVLATAFLGTGVLFWPTLASFPGTWQGHVMSHGWLIAGLVPWLIWRHRDDFLTDRGGDLLLLLPLAVLSLVWFVGTVAHVQVLHQSALVALLIVWGLVVSGRSGLRTVLAIGATMLLAVPLWGSLTPIFRPLTTLMSGGLVKLLGIPALIDGDMIHVTAGSFVIDDGCAGLNYLMAGLVAGAFYAHFLVPRWPAQLAVVGAAALIAIVGNWIRVAALIVIGHVTEMQSGLMEEHLGFGWAIFTAGLVPFFFVAGRIGRRAARGRPGGDGDGGVGDGDEVVGDGAGGVGDGAEVAREGEQVAGPAGRPEEPPGHDRSIPRRAGLATAFAVIGPILFHGFAAMPAVDGGAPGLAELLQDDRWTALEAPGPRPFDWRPGYRGAQQQDTLRFTDGTTRVYGDHFVYRDQAQGAKLIGYPNRLAREPDIVDERVLGPVDPAGRRWVRQAIVRTSEGPVLTWYWYRVGGRETFSALQAKALEVPAFLTRRRSSELIALTVPCGPEDCRDAFETLAGFMGTSRTIEEAPDGTISPEDASP